MRVLAEAAGITQSALSQIETGKAQPSVQTLYRLVRELDMSFDQLLGFNGAADQEDRVDRLLDGGEVVFLPRDQQKCLELDTGVVWHRLVPHSVDGTDFLRIVHPPGSRSAAAGKYVRHSGMEFLCVISGTLHVEVGFDATHVLHPGDAVTFPAVTPHRVANLGTEPAEVICVLMARPSDK